MTNKEMKKRIKELEKEIVFLQTQLAAANANKIVIVPQNAPVHPTIPNTPSPWTPTRPYIGDPVWPGHNPTITCKSSTDVQSQH